MKNKIIVGLGVSLVVTVGGCSAPQAETGKQAMKETLASVMMSDDTGCMSLPTEQFGRYLGDWDIEDWQLSSEDGKTWVPGKGARWNFKCVGDGIAVQDFWMHNSGGSGTNLRIYNAESESWDVVWTATGLAGTVRINAKEAENGDIVMTYVYPEKNPDERIIFYPPNEDGWDWIKQVDYDGGGNWVGVYKIKATRRNAAKAGIDDVTASE